ncbi:proteasome assembly chaperone 2-like [Ptychodera flava]|uniref:proteasome assembly chaperone 2-like n=1 Tax=Ptychodera flava TaxID=63121 RepID=UPI003969E3DC
MYVKCCNSPSDFKGCTLILPAVSVGNVGQLAVDLLVATLNLERVGFIHDDCILPVCGNDAFLKTNETQGKLVTSTEVYYCADQSLVVVQQRAPIVKGKQREFCRKLSDWIKTCQFDKVILLTSSYAHERIDSQIQGSPLRYVVTPTLQDKIGMLLQDDMKWCQFERRDPTWTKSLDKEEEDIPDTAKGVFIPGGGIAKKLFIQGCKDNLPIAVLSVFCAEGDNIPDTFTLISYLNQWLALLPNQSSDSEVPSSSWTIPSSWSLLFGSGVDKSIY